MLNPITHRMTLWCGLSFALASAVLSGCSTQDAARYERTGAVESFPVTIVAVDGLPQAGTSASATSTLEPGLRKLTVQMPRAAGFREGDTRVFELDVKACTQYWLVAQRDTRSTQDFAIRVDHSRSVGSCTAGVATRSAPTTANTPLDAPAKPTPKPAS